jgi:hypothetical protein
MLSRQPPGCCGGMALKSTSSQAVGGEVHSSPDLIANGHWRPKTGQGQVAPIWRCCHGDVCGRMRTRPWPGSSEPRASEPGCRGRHGGRRPAPTLPASAAWRNHQSDPFCGPCYLFLPPDPPFGSSPAFKTLDPEVYSEQRVATYINSTPHYSGRNAGGDRWIECAVGKNVGCQALRLREPHVPGLVWRSHPYRCATHAMCPAPGTRSGSGGSRAGGRNQQSGSSGAGRFGPPTPRRHQQACMTIATRRTARRGASRRRAWWRSSWRWLVASSAPPG